MTTQADTAIALHYNEDLPAPIVVASGRGALARGHRADRPRERGPPRRDPDLAASLIELDVNTLIPESLYEVIANLLVFVRDLKSDARRGDRMKTIKTSDLRDGMKFDKPVYMDGDNVFVPPGHPHPPEGHRPAHPLGDRLEVRTDGSP